MAVPDLRLASTSDIEVLLPLVKSYHDFEQVQLSDQDRRAVLESLLGDNSLGRIWLIERRQEVVGYIALCFGFSIEFTGRDAFIDEFFIIESHRSRGVGAAVLDMVVQKARRLGVRALHLEVARDNRGAETLYASAGFRLRGFQLMSLELDGGRT